MGGSAGICVIGRAKHSISKTVGVPNKNLVCGGHKMRAKQFKKHGAKKQFQNN
jgi:hypothetical protein